MLRLFRKKHLTPKQAVERTAARAEQDFVAGAEALADWLRAGKAAGASDNMRAFARALREQPQQAQVIARAFFQGFTQLQLFATMVQVGIFSRHGFFREMFGRLYDRLNPPPKDAGSLKDVMARIFKSEADTVWLFELAPRDWLRLYRTLAYFAEENVRQKAVAHFRDETVYAVEMLSVWVAAEELNPDLLRLDKRLLDWDSPLIALQREMIALADSVRLGQEAYDDAHARVMLDQSRSLVARLRRRGIGMGAGSSLAVAHLLERLDQTLNRLELLLNIHTVPNRKQRSVQVLRLFSELIQSSFTQNNVSLVWRRSIKMLAKSISNNTSDHGEHYIARTRREAWVLLRSAAGAGILIALMALIKIRIGQMGLSPLSTAILGSLNYGLGFALIHVVHCTVATKQPAMTATSFAAEVERNEQGRAVDRKLASLLITVNRSQTIAVFGNVCVAIAVALVATAVYRLQTGMSILTAAEVRYQLDAVRPLAGNALFYAAIAGVWLFCSGIIAGFFDNRADYLYLRDRLREHPLMARLVPPRWRAPIGNYIHRNYGALAGNFFFGVLLGMTSYIGYVIGVPLDIRHVAFSSANIGYAVAGGQVGALEFVSHLLFVLMIGLVNLWVSFTLALTVALRSRETELGSLRQLLKTVWSQIKENPRLLILPPQETKRDNGKAKEPPKNP
ncbi:MAG: recombinase [Neisseria sp.]|nr:recombinase [Neisseria sp.]